MATTEKMLPPGMMPGKDEIDKYTRLYATAIGSKVCLDYLKNQTAAFTSEELEKQRQDFKKREEERNKEWKKQQERQEYYYQILSNDPDLEDLEYYSLTEEEPTPRYISSNQVKAA